MAHILGNRYCIESLRNDVTDLQGAIIDIFSRVGPVRHPSWKYPDKTSCDLDLTELLELYDYSEDEEERQVAHIVLLELVIDRLVLLLQAMSKYTDHTLLTGRSGASPQSASNTSVGLMVKKYWNKLVQVGAHIQNTQTEIKNKTREVSDLENSLSKVMGRDHDVSGTGTPHVTIPLNAADASRLRSGTLTATSNYSISRDECIKATQTLETAFVPCESCDLVQKHFREVGDSVVSICMTQDLPCSLSRHKSQLEHVDWMSGNDIARWATEQNKDLARINKYLGDLHGTIEPLKGSLDKEQLSNRQLKHKLSESAKNLQLEKETQSVQQRQYEGKIRVIEKKSYDELQKMKKEKEGLEKKKELLQEQIGTMKKELGKQEEMIHELELGKEQVIRDMEERLLNNEHVHQLETDLDTTKQKLDDIKEQLSRANKDLTRERAKGKNVSKQTETLQDKQSGLIHRLDDLDLENEELRSRVSELEEQQEELEEHMETLKEEKRQLKRELTEDKRVVRTLTLEKEKLKKLTESLESDIHQMELKVQEAVEHERLLVEYPDLNGPVNPDLSGTGDLATDMDNQVKANTIRITILEDQNTKLRNSITRLLGSTHSSAQVSRQPVALWSADDSRVDRHQHQYSNGTGVHSSPESIISAPYSDSEYSPPKNSPRTTPTRPARSQRQQSAPKTRESFVVGIGPKSSRPPSGKLAKGPTQASTSTINTYKQLKKAGLIKVGQPRPPSAKVSPPDRDDYSVQDVFSCPKCDKMYNSCRDLDLHKSYCFGGI